LFAQHTTKIFCRARPSSVRDAPVKKFSGGEDYDGLDQFLFAAFLRWAHCARRKILRQLDCLCIASEISAKLFDFLGAMLFTACSVEKCAALRQARIEVLPVDSM